MIRNPKGDFGTNGIFGKVQPISRSRRSGLFNILSVKREQQGRIDETKCFSQISNYHQKKYFVPNFPIFFVVLLKSYELCKNAQDDDIKHNDAVLSDLFTDFRNFL